MLVSICAMSYNTVYVCLCIKIGLLYYDTMGDHVMSRWGYIWNYSIIYTDSDAMGYYIKGGLQKCYCNYHDYIVLCRDQFFSWCNMDCSQGHSHPLRIHQRLRHLHIHQSKVHPWRPSHFLWGTRAPWHRLRGRRLWCWIIAHTHCPMSLTPHHGCLGARPLP